MLATFGCAGWFKVGNPLATNMFCKGNIPCFCFATGATSFFVTLFCASGCFNNHPSAKAVGYNRYFFCFECFATSSTYLVLTTFGCAGWLNVRYPLTSSVTSCSNFTVCGIIATFAFAGYVRLPTNSLTGCHLSLVNFFVMAKCGYWLSFLFATFTSSSLLSGFGASCLLGNNPIAKLMRVRACAKKAHKRHNNQ